MGKVPTCNSFGDCERASFLGQWISNGIESHFVCAGLLSPIEMWLRDLEALCLLMYLMRRNDNSCYVRNICNTLWLFVGVCYSLCCRWWCWIVSEELEVDDGRILDSELGPGTEEPMPGCKLGETGEKLRKRWRFEGGW